MYYLNFRVILSQLSPELTSYLTLMSNENAAVSIVQNFILYNLLYLIFKCFHY